MCEKTGLCNRADHGNGVQCYQLLQCCSECKLLRLQQSNTCVHHGVCIVNAQQVYKLSKVGQQLHTDQ
jgi:hypothetical protein